MNMIQFKVHIEELDCTASLNVDLDKQAPEFWEQFEGRGEAIEQAVIDAAERLGAQLRQEYDNVAAVKARVEELGRDGGGE